MNNSETFLIVDNKSFPLLEYEINETILEPKQIKLNHFQAQRPITYEITMVLKFASSCYYIYNDLYSQTKDLYILNKSNIYKLENTFINHIDYVYDYDDEEDNIINIIGTSYRVIFYNKSNLNDLDNDFIKDKIKQELRLKKLDRIINN